MNRTTAWALGGVAVLGCLGFGISNLSGQRFGPASEAGSVGRYVVVRNTDDAVIIMDSTTGDLYKATADDLKSFRDRPALTPSPRQEKDRTIVTDKDVRVITDKDKVTPPQRDKSATPPPPPGPPPPDK